MAVKTMAVDLTETNTMSVTPQGGTEELYPYAGASLRVSFYYPWEFDYTVNPPQRVKGTPQYAVDFHTADGRKLRIPMGLVSNQGTWVNTEPGATIALDDIQAKIDAATN